jgi:GAF domain-containing protein
MGQLLTSHDEDGRLAALHQYGLDSYEGGVFARIAADLARDLNSPIAGISVVDATSIRATAAVGCPVRRMPRASGFCTYNILSNEPLAVRDATADVRFAHLPHVRKGPQIRAYAGAPLIDPRGYRLGAVCVADPHPRTYSRAQIATLQAYAARTMCHIELQGLRIAGHRDLGDFLLDSADAAQRRRDAVSVEYFINLFFALTDEPVQDSDLRPDAPDEVRLPLH